MININKLSKRKAVSPVIATVILVAVAITISIGVSYWMSSIAGQYTSFEKVEIQTAACSITSGYWEITVNLKNSGTQAATITDVFVNDVKAELSSDDTTPSGTVITAYLDDDEDPTTPLPCALLLDTGASGVVTAWIPNPYGTLSPGTTVNIKIHSAAGMDYIRLVKLI